MLLCRLTLSLRGTACINYRCRVGDRHLYVGAVGLRNPNGLSFGADLSDCLDERRVITVTLSELVSLLTQV